MCVYLVGHAVTQLCKELRYKSQGRGFDTRWCLSGRTLALGSTEPQAEMSIGNISWEVKAAYV